MEEALEMTKVIIKAHPQHSMVHVSGVQKSDKNTIVAENMYPPF